MINLRKSGVSLYIKIFFWKIFFGKFFFWKFFGKIFFWSGTHFSGKFRLKVFEKKRIIKKNRNFLTDSSVACLFRKTLLQLSPISWSMRKVSYKMTLFLDYNYIYQQSWYQPAKLISINSLNSNYINMVSENHEPEISHFPHIFKIKYLTI